jgi:hypothetical protein
LWGKLLYGQDRNFSQISFCGSAKRLRIVCGVSIRKSVNSVGLERDFFRQKQAFYKCDPKWGEIQNDYRNQEEKQAD